ncbi:MAG TPA: GntR family transcriptional regulator [Vicinamibacterales bacterium]|jgi:GntR family transcriptional regulator|nr:GntR family transcriptional regulator [Vicinamibacterales bacterium]
MSGSPRVVLPPISAAGPGTLYQQIVDGLKRQVSEGRLPPGTALPSFRVLAEDLLVSVITVKRAYEELEREGLVYRRQGLGTFVADAAQDRSRDVKTERARELLQTAVREASEAGLSARDIVELLHSVLEEREPKHVRKRG